MLNRTYRRPWQWVFNCGDEIHALLQVNLCGHATLAASHFLFTSGLVNANKIEFLTRSGVLTAKRVPETKQTDSLNLENGEARDCFMIELDFPVIPLTEFDSAELPSISKALNGASVIELKKTTTDGDLFVCIIFTSTILAH